MGKQAGGVCSMGKPRTLFDCFLELLRGGRADAFQQPAAERGFQNRGAVVPAWSFARKVSVMYGQTVVGFGKCNYVPWGGGAQVVDVIDEHDNRAFLRGFYDFGNHD
jgi:hypothetical protein